MSDQLKNVLEVLEARRPTIDRLDRHYMGKAPISFLSYEAKAALGQRLDCLTSNLCRLAVNSIAERLRIQGFQASRHERKLREAWSRNDLDQLSPVLHREALALGTGYVLVWADADGKAVATVESAHQVSVVRDPATRKVTAAVKRWEDDKGTYATLFLPDTVTTYHSHYRGQGSNLAGWRVLDSMDNPLGEVPVVAFVNGDRLHTEGDSEMSDLIPLVDALTKLLSDMMVGSEYYARPRRWATGVELEEDENGEAVNPFPESNRMMISENDQAKFGSLSASDLKSYQAAIDVVMSQIMAVSALPAHYVGVTNSNPASADAIRSAEASLTARAEARQATYGPGWERVARLILAIETDSLPSDHTVHVVWNDPATRSVAQEADAVVKLYQSGLLPQTYALARLGYTPEDIDAIRAAAREEALDKAVLDGI